jgi:hypothetical protein
MDKVIKRRWVEALRSGKYKQGKNRLNGKDGFCCLGVLCDLAVEDGVGSWHDYGDEGNKYFDDLGRIEATLLPLAVQQWSGLWSETGDIGRGRSLSRLNDDGVSFRRIARKIERRL